MDSSTTITATRRRPGPRVGRISAHYGPYADLGPDHFDKLDTARLQRHHVRRLKQLGFSVTLQPAAAA